MQFQRMQPLPSQDGLPECHLIGLVHLFCIWKNIKRQLSTLAACAMNIRSRANALGSHSQLQGHSCEYTPDQQGWNGAASASDVSGAACSRRTYQCCWQSRRLMVLLWWCWRCAGRRWLPGRFQGRPCALAASSEAAAPPHQADLEPPPAVEATVN